MTTPPIFPTPEPTGNFAPLGGPPDLGGAGAPPISSPLAGPVPSSMFPMPSDPSAMQYLSETQDDGSVLLRIKKPDGTPGRVVKIVPAPVKAGAPGPMM